VQQAQSLCGVTRQCVVLKHVMRRRLRRRRRRFCKCVDFVNNTPVVKTITVSVFVCGPSIQNYYANNKHALVDRSTS